MDVGSYVFSAFSHNRPRVLAVVYQNPVVNAVHLYVEQVVDS